MNISKVLEQLRKELEHLDAAIVSLERLQQKGSRRGRTPKAQSELKSAGPAIRPAGDRRQIRRGDPTD
jgi:hypothetical protein